MYIVYLCGQVCLISAVFSIFRYTLLLFILPIQAPIQTSLQLNWASLV